MNNELRSGRTRKTRRLGTRVSLVLALAALPAAASEGGVDYRTHVMAAVGGHMQSAAEILRQRVPYQAHLTLHAEALAELAGITDTLFEEGSEGGDALPEIWQDVENFDAKLNDFQEAAARFNAAVAAQENVPQAFQALGQSCKSCHDDYRAE
jgi:cytochrome c556